MNDYYVYAYLRNVNSSNGSEGTPYYIGKGRKKRLFEKHTITVPKNKKYIEKLFENLTESQALEIEERLILEYGRIDLGNGILHNKTNGGDGGTSGRIVSIESRIKSSLSNRGQKRSNKTVENLKKAQRQVDRNNEKNPFYNKKHSDETKLKMSLSKKGKTWQEIYGEKAETKRQAVREKLLGKLKGPQNKVTCPNCGKIGGQSIMKRWHGDRCKLPEGA